VQAPWCQAFGPAAAVPYQSHSPSRRTAHWSTPLLSASMKLVSRDSITRLESSTDALRNHVATVRPGPVMARLGVALTVASPEPLQCRYAPVGPPATSVVAAESVAWFPWPERSSARALVMAAWS
jgi:hypothetical protein